VRIIRHSESKIRIKNPSPIGGLSGVTGSRA
jgi:hypothetical protein